MYAVQTRGERLVRGVVNRYEEAEYAGGQFPEPLTLDEQEFIDESIVQITARVGVNMEVRQCECRLVKGGVVECAHCHLEGGVT